MNIDDRDIERVSALATALFCAEVIEPVIVEGPLAPLGPDYPIRYRASCRTILESGSTSSEAVAALEDRLVSLANRMTDRLQPVLAASLAARDRREGIPPRPAEYSPAIADSAWNSSSTSHESDAIRRTEHWRHFHALWTRTNGPRYEKSSWTALERQLIAATSEASIEAVMAQARALNAEQNGESNRL